MIQWPGGVKMQIYKMQIYRHSAPASYAVLQSVPESRPDVSADRADEFVRDILRFSHGKVVSDGRKADAGQIGQPGRTFRRSEMRSGLGGMLVLVTDGHLPYPFGHELTGDGGII